MFEYKGIKIQWLGHDSFLLAGNVRVIIDPFKITKHEKADLILISHNHFDHCNIDDIKNVSTGDTIIIA
ncbi:MAG TPA: MBL fold metallo-hydrolase, partial [Candidatus Nitrosotalea sp.]|nr:MBL fold metallo-hydrolase [Candidatus Nitrosotalea sp.]